MRFLDNISIGRKMTLIIVVVSGTSLLLACLLLFAYDVVAIRRGMRADLVTLMDVVVDNSTAALTFHDEKVARELLDTLRAQSNITVGCIYDEKGEPFATYVRDANARFDPPAPGANEITFGKNRLFAFRQIKLNGELLGTVYLESDFSDLYGRLRNYPPVILLVLLIASSASFLLASWLQGVISRPILDLVETTRQVSDERKYSIRCPMTTKDEIGQLIAGFNEMLSQIEQRDEELQRHRDNLEEEVGRRTAELQAINTQLTSARDAAEAASRAKGQFLANMSHEIRTPLNGVIGMTELVLDTELKTDQREHLSLVKSSGESLLNVINDILDFSKVESGKLELERIEFNLYKSLGEGMKALAFRAHQKGLELVYDISPEVPSQLIGDPGRIRQILTNLVGNAVKFTDHGEIVVKVDLEREENKNEALLHFKVTDTGIGIPEDKQGLLFQAFTQADASTTRKYGGTGLGLAICARLVGLMNGKIWVESKPNQGSIFHFTARFTRTEQAQDTPSVNAETLKGIPLLIVDDNQTNRGILIGLATRWGIKATAVADAEAGLAAIRLAHEQGAPFRIVLTDCHMPGMDGFQFAEKIPEFAGAARPIILMLTSAGQRGEAERCKKAGIAGYLLKPVMSSDLQNAMLTLLGRQQLKSRNADLFPLVTRHSLRESVRKLHILVAEDTPVNQVLISRLLEKLGHSHMLAKNGKEAVALATSHKFDLILMDVQMPEMDGLEATSAIRSFERESGVHTPIFAVTAHAMKGDNEICFRAGMDGYVTKPVRLGDLASAIESSTTMTAQVGQHYGSTAAAMQVPMEAGAKAGG
jgi:signal transduction histidine kinase/CheY-like chemotaxis protein